VTCKRILEAVTRSDSRARILDVRAALILYGDEKETAYSVVM
jgi:hypothetical protein